MRHRGNKIAIMIFVGGIVVIMSFFGLNRGMQGRVVGAAATVNGNNISLADFQGQVRVTTQNLQQRFGGQQRLTPELMKMLQVREQSLERLIQHQLHVDAAQREGLLVAPDELRQEILDTEAFKDPETKQFSMDRYKAVLERGLYISPVTPAEFEKRLTQDLLSSRLFNMVRAVSAPSAAESQDKRKLEGTRYTLEYAIIKPDAFPQSIKPSDAEVKAYLEDKANETKIKEQYFSNIKAYRQDKQYKVSHIMIPLLPDASADDKAKATAKATEAVKAIKGGLAWDSAVAKYTQQESSKKKGGDLGFIAKSSYGPTFDETVSKLKVGEVSAPVETKLGVHVIKLTQIKEAVNRQMEDETVRKEIALVLLQRAANEKGFEKRHQEIDQALKEGKPFNVAIQKDKAKGLEIKATTPFDLSSETVPGVGTNSPELMDFLVTAKEGTNCPKLFAAREDWMACRIKKIDTPKPIAESEGPDSQHERDKFYHLLQAWTETIEKQAKVVRNESLLKYDEI
jgi:peptidyl-prolyl cis-trans isomerase D